MDRYFWHLSPRQASGIACVLCGRDLMTDTAVFVPVGRDPSTESLVYACTDPCAISVAQDAEQMAAELRSLTGTQGCSEAAGSIGQDGEFGALLRDMRILVGNEALLAVISDIPTLRFLLQLTSHHADMAASRSRTLLDRVVEEQGGGGEG
ncbi:hypothetical protein [Streptomyces sp. NPDC059063]|uniref:hypothetical protein n=1 Tax=unclassified Streptomyces TaxID=2593676 RepID=UPI00367CE510